MKSKLTFAAWGTSILLFFFVAGEPHYYKSTLRILYFLVPTTIALYFFSKKESPCSNKYEILCLITIGTAFIAYFNSQKSIFSTLTLLEIACWFILLILMARHGTRSSYLLHTLNLTLLVAFAISVGRIAYIWQSDMNPYSYPWVSYTPHFWNIRHSGFLIILPLCSIFSNINSTDRIWNLKPSALILIISFLLWTGNRATILSFTTFLLIFSLLNRSFINRRNLLTAISFIYGALISIIFATSSSSMGVLGLFIRSNVLEDRDITSGRLERWERALSGDIGDLILGKGPGSYFMESPSILDWHPHNIFVHYWSEYGLLFLLTFLILIFYSLSNGVKRRNSEFPTLLGFKLNNKFLVSFIISLLIYGTFDGPTFIGIGPVVFFVSLGTLLGCNIEPTRRPILSENIFSLSITSIIILTFILNILNYWNIIQMSSYQDFDYNSSNAKIYRLAPTSFIYLEEVIKHDESGQWITWAKENAPLFYTHEVISPIKEKTRE